MKLMVDGLSTKIKLTARSFTCLSTHRGSICPARPCATCPTCWRRLTADRQALLALAHLRCGHTYAQLAAGFGIGPATVCRYIAEAVEVLPALAPTLQQAMTVAANKAFVILDGTLLSIDRIATDRPYYSGKHKRHGMNVQVIADAFGRMLWTSPALSGAVHDIKAARTASSKRSPKPAPDVGRQGISRSSGTIRVSYRGRWSTLPAGKRR